MLREIISTAFLTSSAPILPPSPHHQWYLHPSSSSSSMTLAAWLFVCYEKRNKGHERIHTATTIKSKKWQKRLFDYFRFYCFIRLKKTKKITKMKEKMTGHGIDWMSCPKIWEKQTKINLSPLFFPSSWIKSIWKVLNKKIWATCQGNLTTICVASNSMAQ